MWRSVLIASLCVGLTGCTKDLPFPWLFSARHVSTASSQVKGIVMAMGQSNMECASHPDKTPAVAFQKAYPNVIVRNCAVGGTSILEWDIGSHLDNECVASLSSVNNPVIGVIWYQGESDSGTGMTDWNQRFTTLVGKWRARWGNVPVVYAQIATRDPIAYPSPTWDLIKSQQASLFIPNGRMVVTEDQPREDRVHLTGEGSLEVGRRMAQAFSELNQGGN